MPTWCNPGQFNCINPPSKVAIAANKLATFRKLGMNRVPIPDFTTYESEAVGWSMDGHLVLARYILTGNSGQGIELVEPHSDEVPYAPLYTKYTKAKYEYRIHVMNGEIIDFVQKKKRSGVEANPHIRSHNYGWIFARDGVVLPNKVKEAALAAIHAIGLDFGAVDIGYKVNEDKAFVYEVNTAPGLEGTTLQRYITAFKENYLV